MQVDRFTVKSQEALAAAQRLAGARSNPQVAPQHLFAALLEQEGGLVVPVLEKVGADVTGVRRKVNEALDGFPTVTGDATEAPALSTALSDTLKRADEEARGFADEYVSTEHLLLALASDPNVDAGASREQLADAVLAAPDLRPDRWTILSERFRAPGEIEDLLDEAFSAERGGVPLSS
jgi:ATP-dependent Clp protease ATP-binding subunit ClpB